MESAGLSASYEAPKDNMIVLFTGLPGAGKSLKMSRTIIKVLYRNQKYWEKAVKRWRIERESTPNLLPPKPRRIYSNLKLSPEVEAEFGVSTDDHPAGAIRYWWDPSQLIDIRDADVFWDEIATHLDATQWQNMSLEIKRWLQQHRKFGIEVYGTTQDFAMIDKSMRRLTSDLYIITKMMGSGDKSATKPEIKNIWGISMVQAMDPQTYDEEESKQKAGWPSFMFFTRADVEVFDTTQEIKMGKYPPLNHIERECGNPECQYHKVLHV